MNDDQPVRERRNIETLYKRAAIHARAKGYKEEAHDFAGWIAIKWLEGKSQHQTIDQAFIDFLRGEYGGTGIRSGSDGLLRSHRATMSEKSEFPEYPINKIIEHRLSQLDQSEGSDPELAAIERESRARRRVTCRDIKDSGILHLYEDGFTLGEIGGVYGFTESRASQILKVIRKEVEREAGLQRMRDRIELNETELEIRWLSI